MVLLYQLFFIVFILGASCFGIPIFIGALMFSLMFTLSNVFTIQLLVLQSTTIIVTSCIGYFIALFVSIKNNVEKFDRKTVIKYSVISILGILIYFNRNMISSLYYFYKPLFILVTIIGFIIVCYKNEYLRNKYFKVNTLYSILISILIFIAFGIFSIVIWKISELLPGTSLAGFILLLFAFFCVPRLICNLFETDKPIIYFSILFMTWKYLTLISDLVLILAKRT